LDEEVIRNVVRDLAIRSPYAERAQQGRFTMEVENSTYDDAMVRVAGGPGGIPKMGKPPKPVKPAKPSKPLEWLVKKGTLVSPKLPSPPYTLLFLIAGKEVGRVEVKSPSVKRLRLTKVSNSGYKVLQDVKK
jgi:hypothetical protein